MEPEFTGIKFRPWPFFGIITIQWAWEGWWVDIPERETRVYMWVALKTRVTKKTKSTGFVCGPFHIRWWNLNN